MSQAATTEPKDAAQEGFELRITRTFDAPRELVWKAWTEPEMAKQWAGPRGFRATEFSRLSEAGSSWRMTMEGHRPGVQSIATLHQGGTVKEVRPPELLVYTFAWLDPAEVGLTNKDVQEMVVTVRLEEKGSKTVMTFTQGPFLSAGARDGHNGGWNSAFDKFAEFLMAEQPGRVEDPEDVPTELHLKRFFAAPRELVFAAWTKPEMVAAWWGPRGFTTAVKEWDARSGGSIYATMHGMGQSHPMSGRFVEVYPPYRFHFTVAALDNDGHAMFENWNSVFFEEVEGGTQIMLDVHVMHMSDVAPRYLKGMSQGWIQSLERLKELVETMQKDGRGR